MQYKTRSKSQRRSAVPMMFVIGLAAIAIFTISSAARIDYGTAPQQDVIRLENRINQMEQRLYSIEGSLRNLEQQSRITGANSRSLNQEDWAALRSEIEALQHRLLEDECALARLDERTLARDLRAARKTSGAANNPCRMNFDAPLRLPDSP